jgi:hypothetical protein
MFEDTDLAFYLDWQMWRRHYVSAEDDEPRLTRKEAAVVRRAIDAAARFNHHRPQTWEGELLRLRGVDGPSLAITRYELAYPAGVIRA